MKISMILTMPPPLNQLYFNVPGKGRVLGFKGKAWKVRAGWEARKHWVGPPSCAAFSVTINLYVKHTRDIDSSSKLLLDAMQGIVYENDTQVDELNIRRFKAPKGEDGWIDVTVTETD